MRPPYPAATMLLTVELVDAGWTPTEVRRILAKEGHPAPSLTTIYIWTRPEYRERHSASTRRRAARRTASSSSFRWPANRSAEWRMGRIKALSALDLSMAAVAKIMSFDFPDVPLTEHQVRYALQHGRIPTAVAA